MNRTAIGLGVLLVLSSLGVARDITATVKNGSLIVNGTPGVDVVTLMSSGGTLVVSPALGTTVNGVLGDFPAVGVTKDVRVDLGGGNDGLLMDIDVPRDLLIGLGDGGDTVAFGARVKRDLRVDLGPGRDAVYAQDFSVGRDIRVVDGEQWDILEFEDGDVAGDFLLEIGAPGPLSGGVKMTNLDVGKRLTIRASGYPGDVKLTNVACGARVKMKFGDGARLRIVDCTFHHDFKLRCSGLFSVLEATNFFIGGDLRVKSTAAGAVWSMTDVPVSRDLRLDLSDGFDEIYMTRVAARATKLSCGDGNDHFETSLVTVKRDAKIQAGEGSNYLLLLDWIVNHDLRITAGSGDDTVILTGTTVGGKKTVKTGGGTDTVE